MTLSQIKKFLKESVEQKRKWIVITLLGGKPTLHPEIFEIAKELLFYKRTFSNETKILLATNGNGNRVSRVLSEFPDEIEIQNTKKKSKTHDVFYSFNVAPIALFRYKFVDYTNGCSITDVCGIGLNRYGYYPCGVGGAIDRIFGLDIGRKSLPQPNDFMTDQFQQLCKYCGRFKLYRSHAKPKQPWE
jgi:hypothetical protein